LEAFAHFKDYVFIVKVDREDLEFKQLASLHANVHVFNWVPQRELLGLFFIEWDFLRKMKNCVNFRLFLVSKNTNNLNNLITIKIVDAKIQLAQKCAYSSPTPGTTLS
jgi:hypothetical protein